MYSIVIPVHDEEENVIPLLQEVVESLAGNSFEVIFIDDGSTDNTLSQLIHAKTRIPQLRVIRHSNKSGQSAAIRSGIIAAKYETIITLDGDGQNDPHDIPAMIEAYKNAGQDVGLVIGYRKKRHDNLLRKFSSKIANKIRSYFLQDSTPDSGCGLKVFQKQAFLNLPYFDHIHRFFPSLIKMTGQKIIITPVNHRPRSRGQSKYGLFNRLWVGIVDLFGVKWLQKRYRIPLTTEEC